MVYCSRLRICPFLSSVYRVSPWPTEAQAPPPLWEFVSPPYLSALLNHPPRTDLLLWCCFLPSIIFTVLQLRTVTTAFFSPESSFSWSTASLPRCPLFYPLPLVYMRVLTFSSFFSRTVSSSSPECLYVPFNRRF